MSTETPKIEKNTVVAFHYTLVGEDGDKIESTLDSEASIYLHGGYGNLLPKLEQALDGQEKGAEISITLPPENAYGLRRGDSMQRVPIKHLLTKSKKLKPGMPVRVNTSEGPRDVMIVKVGRFNVDVDTNHPLAGRTLTFDIKVEDIRPATPQEISHRHSHGWEAHDH